MKKKLITIPKTWLLAQEQERSAAGLWLLPVISFIPENNFWGPPAVPAL
jgi:hypothetical protein